MRFYEVGGGVEVAPFISIIITVFSIIMILVIKNEMRLAMAMKLFSHRHWFTHHHLEREGGWRVNLVGGWRLN